MPADLDPVLTDLSLERLQRRRSVKWSRYPDDVLPAWVAEMDFPLAQPVERALSEAIELGDCGYADPAGLGPGPQFGPQGGGFARLNLGTSPALVEAAVERICRALGRA